VQVGGEKKGLGDGRVCKSLWDSELGKGEPIAGQIAKSRKFESAKHDPQGQAPKREARKERARVDRQWVSAWEWREMPWMGKTEKPSKTAASCVSTSAAG
jgi:hypothetical protein